jgi:long-chain acyl-CoA synthetase
MARRDTIRAAFYESTLLHSNNLALTMVGEKGYTYHETYNQVFVLAQKLSSIGIKKGDKIAILSNNCPHWGICYLATLFTGAVVIPILYDFSKKEIENILEHSEAKALFISANLHYKFSAGASENLKHVINVDDFSINKDLSPDKDTDFKAVQETDCLSENVDTVFGAIAEDDLAAIIYTSGTTGTSKGVMLSHKNLVSNIYAIQKIQDINPSDRLLSVLPLPHTYECTIGFLMPLFLGASIHYISGSPTASILIPALQQVKPTMMLTVPLIIEKIYKSKIKPEFSKGILKVLYPIPPVRKLLNRLAGKKLMKTFGGEIHFFGVGGAMLDAETEKFLREAKFPYAIGYGLTETSPLLAGCAPCLTKYRSTGFALPGQEMKLINVDPKKGEGEIVVKGHNIMSGYFKNAELTRSVFTEDGWFRTGDLGFLDKEKFLYIKGRLKNVILGANGENIYPEEIEALLNRQNLVLESIVYQMKGKLVAKVHLDNTELEKRYAMLKESAKQFQSDFEQYINSILDEIRFSVNGEVNNFSKLAIILQQPVPFEKTPTLKIKKYLYI